MPSPGAAIDELLVASGTRGVVVNIVHPQEMPEAEIYLVRFETDEAGTLGEPVGCLEDELSEAVSQAGPGR